MTRFFTNREENTLFNKFKGIFENNPDLEWFDALIGYFRSSGYFKIRPLLENIPHVRILVGINADRILSKYNEQGLLFRGDSEETIKEALLNLKQDIAECDYSEEVEKGILQFIEDIASQKLEIRAHTTQKLHAKIYIFRPENWNEHKQGSVITGSSNLSDAGLGSGKVSNYEFNVLLNDYDDVRFATEEFERLWNESVAILPSQIEGIKKESYLNDSITPFELYVKMLSAYLGKSIDYNPDSVELPPKYKKLSYQIDAVNQGYDKLAQYNGFFLSDVVGLGKTVVALMIAKKFFFGNGFPEHISKILIITPPAVKSAWERAVDDFGLKTCKIITNGSIHKEQKRFASYDLVIVDEAHKFRNSTSEGYDVLQRLCKSKAPQGGMLGKNASKKKIILISATPLNNDPSDIQNQVYLFQDGGNTDLDIPNLDDFFKDIKKEYQIAKTLDEVEQKERVADIYTRLREAVIAPLTVRRTRADLLENESYKRDLDEQGIKFPVPAPPGKLYYKLSADLDYLFDRTLNCLANELNFSRYKAIAYLKPEYKSRYTTADMASTQLQHIMKCLLVKRLDSSFFAFKQSLKKFKNAIEAMLKMLADDHVFIMNKVDVTTFILNDEVDALLRLFEEKKEDHPDMSIFHAEDFEKSFKTALEHDLDIVQELNDEWSIVDDDPKYDEFLRQLKSNLLNKKHNPSGKVVVFSEAEDTTKYLFERLHADGITKILTVYSKTRDQLEETIKENFDANLKKDEQKNEYDIIICTEVLAEGVNLHRAAVIVNYDTPWNSTRLMQRVGRINRIGSKNERIYIYNFFPTVEVNNAIELEKKASLKLHAFHYALGSDSQIYSPDDEAPGSFGLFSTEITEEKDERLKILLWLRQFRDENPEWYKRISDLPLKVRCARFATEDTPPAVFSVIYLKNKKRDTFFMVDDTQEHCITFLDAEKLLRCSSDTARQKLPSLHYTHIKRSLAVFTRQVEDSAGQQQVVSSALNSKEKKSIAVLEAFKNLDFVNDMEKKKLTAAQDAIRDHRFNKLYKEVNKLTSNNLRPIDNLTALLKLIDKYISDVDAEPMEDQEVIAQEFGGVPQIIISETLV